ncbi:MAG: fibronectin/fibrinogen-binding protein [Clostridiales bacterium]|jgi:predicted ribosome quality control (RQC) complex YloA/Tae2 family protein|nr:fibronectin/fibrinogen-binding protein [Clostridiales bacterium]
MALDGAFLSCLREELSAVLNNARIEKIHQPSREELVISLRTRDGVKKLYMSARSNSPRVNLTETSFENPASPPMFCMLLRKYLSGGRIAAIRQIGLERILYFDLDCASEIGDIVRLTLAVEIMGRHSNIILTGQNGIIIDAIKRISSEKSEVHPVLPGIPYSPPPLKAGSMDLTRCEPADIVRALDSAGDLPLSQALLKISHGLSPLLCREVSFLATRGRDTNIRELTDEEKQRVEQFLVRVKKAVVDGERRCPYILCDSHGEPVEFSFMPITQYGLSAVGRELDSFSGLLDEFYSKKDAALRLKRQSQDILRALTNISERIARKLENQRRELSQSENRDHLRIFGDLINANIANIQKGASFAEVVDYYQPDCPKIRIPLDPSLSPSQNAQKYYKEYRKAQNAERILAEQIRLGEQELEYLDTVFDALSRAGTPREIGELRAELEAGGYLRRQRSRQKPAAPLGPLQFKSDDGFTILVGRNNVQNDRLTLKTARANDIWLHTRNIPGSHVIIQTNGENPPDSTLEQAAVIAALHSKAAASSQVPVDYTIARNVKKPSGAPPGKVVYHSNRTLFITPDPALAKRLKAD